MEEWEIATALRGARPHPLFVDAPHALRPWLLAVEWDRERLWRIDRPVTALPVNALRWCYPLPWWRGTDQSWFQVAPRDVIDRPGTYPEHDDRIAGADLARPLHVLHRHGRWMILDGIHRLVKADLEGRPKVPVVPLGRPELARIVVRAPAPTPANQGAQRGELSNLTSWT
jgi:hypothetical protein